MALLFHPQSNVLLFKSKMEVRSNLVLITEIGSCLNFSFSPAGLDCDPLKLTLLSLTCPSHYYGQGGLQPLKRAL